MPLQYPSNSPYNPYQQVGKPKNWPLIILIALGVVIVVGFIVLWIMNIVSYDLGDNSNNNGGLGDNNSIAVGEPNPAACNEDLYNCSDFTTSAEAQAVYDVCFSQTGKDVHQLDNDGDGKVCEGLG